MSALGDRVKARYSNQIIANASNPQNAAGGATIDDTRLQLAVTDVLGAFLRKGFAYDDANVSHVLTAVDGVLARLLVLTGQGDKQTWTDFDGELDELKITDKAARDRMVPTTSSVLTPTAENATGGTVRPDFDVRNFDQLTPRAPRGGSPTDPDWY